MINGLELMADYVFLSKYSQRKENGELETWEESVDRIWAMHNKKLSKIGLLEKVNSDMIEKAIDLEKRKIILSSQRARQFASEKENSGILKHEAKMYNCTSTYVDRVEVFSEIMYLLLCGCGVGYSLHKKYINKLPNVIPLVYIPEIVHKIEDSIEGWADSIFALINGLYDGYVCSFDYSSIRPSGALIDGKFRAPGAEPLKKCHKNIINIFHNCQTDKLKSIEIHDIICFIAESVVSGGVRRSAMICLFDKSDSDMISCKTGNWVSENPQRAMANNSILLSKSEQLRYNELKEIMKVVKQWGEPGFVNVPSYDYVVNPCGEIVMKPVFEGDTGFSFCNLVEINGEKIKTEKDFYEACEIASFVATIQALYTDFKYISNTSKKIAEKDRNIGVSITGALSSSFFKNTAYLEKGAKIVAQTNKDYSDLFNINHSRTCTTIKPSGNASSILGLAFSGIHPAHAKKYLRRIRIKNNSNEYNFLKNTPMIKKVTETESIISFPIEVPMKDAIFKDNLLAVEHLKFIGMIKHFWINKGCIEKHVVNNNVSATVEVEDNEWDEVSAVLFTNQYLLTGLSFLPKIGDQMYFNAPFTRLSNSDLKKEYESIENYIINNNVDFLKIMSHSENYMNAGDIAATACAGGACSIS